ncbi:MAG TPA: hypothetical protein VHP34_05760, partial [Alphaproteobacteria bacterium]|nr:hypothetical protein [Alphaproteobacteria bacterium]
MAETGTSTAGFGGGKFRLRGDIIFAVGIVAILTALILPMPSWMLDICLALSLALSVLILMTVL